MIRRGERRAGASPPQQAGGLLRPSPRLRRIYYDSPRRVEPGHFLVSVIRGGEALGSVYMVRAVRRSPTKRFRKYLRVLAFGRGASIPEDAVVLVYAQETDASVLGTVEGDAMKHAVKIDNAEVDQDEALGRAGAHLAHVLVVRDNWSPEINAWQSIMNALSALAYVALAAELRARDREDAGLHVRNS
jgi:hypothetical protein